MGEEMVGPLGVYIYTGSNLTKRSMGRWEGLLVDINVKLLYPRTTVTGLLNREEISGLAEIERAYHGWAWADFEPYFDKFWKIDAS